MTLDALCELYLAEGAVHKKPTTLRSDRGRIKNHIVRCSGSCASTASPAPMWNACSAR
jgi:hypothetical protein